MFSRNQVSCPKIENFDVLQLPKTLIYLVEILYKFTTNFYKRVFRIFFILFRTWVICQNKRSPGFYILTKTRLINNWGSKQNKNNPEHLFVDIGKTETCAKFQQKFLSSMVVGLVKVFDFSGKKPGFSEIKEICLNLTIGFCSTYSVLSNYKTKKTISP